LSRGENSLKKIAGGLSWICKMEKEKISLLNPKVEDIKKHIEMHEEEWNFADRIIYVACLDAVREVKLCEIQEKDIKGPIKTFLINWGMMTRVLGRKKYKDWEKNLRDVFLEICDKLENFRNLNLIDYKDISKLREDIEECYQRLKSIVGPTSTSKILHLICPTFFPMWDVDIRKKVNIESKSLGNGKIDDTKEGYYKFIIEIQKFLIKYDKILLELSEKYNKPKLRITDAFMWKMSR